MNRIVIVLPLLALLAARASAFDGRSFLSGNELVSECRNTARLEARAAYESDELNKCLGYVMGVSDEMELRGLLGDTTNVTAGQLAKVVVKYGDDHPEDLNKAAVQIVEAALRKAFPK